jgi:hypothetical protein
MTNMFVYSSTDHVSEFMIMHIVIIMGLLTSVAPASMTPITLPSVNMRERGFTSTVPRHPTTWKETNETYAPSQQYIIIEESGKDLLQ